MPTAQAMKAAYAARSSAYTLPRSPSIDGGSIGRGDSDKRTPAEKRRADAEGRRKADEYNRKARARARARERARPKHDPNGGSGDGRALPNPAGSGSGLQSNPTYRRT